MSTPSVVRVAIVNDYEVVVRGVHSMLAPFEDRVEVVELDVQLPVAQQVDITLLDSFAQGWLDSPALDQALADPGVGGVVLFSWNMHPELVELALGKGCRGYLDKSAAAEDLVTALERIAAGEVVVSPTRIPRPGQDPEGVIDYPGRAEGLSEREAEVVALITQGLTNADIAARCYLSINTVKTYIRNAYRKIGVTRRPQAVRWGLEHGMVPRVLRDVDPETPDDQAGV